jgi:hypothetical protein
MGSFKVRYRGKLKLNGGHKNADNMQETRCLEYYNHYSQPQAGPPKT